jgi:lysozyme
MRHIIHFERPNGATKCRAVSEKGINLIKRFEGFEPEIYLDAAGLPTIGYGHLLRPGEDEIFKNGISPEAGEALLIKDVLLAEQAVCRLIKVPLTDSQFDALVSFTFNLGSGALQRSTLRRKVNHEEHDEVPEQFMRWVWAGGRRLRGLIRRRKEESILYSA